MLFRIDPSSDVPLFAQAAASVRAAAADGRLNPGDRLPPAREVADALGINLHTVLKAYQQLRDEGLVDMRRGRGAVITDAAAPLAQLYDDTLTLARRAHALGISTESLAAILTEMTP